MPNTISYDPSTHELHIGTGTIANVTPAMWDYTVSGVHVIREWFNDRRRDRTPTVIGDREVSPLWRIHSDTWRAAYTADLLNLLNILGLLASAEPAQATLLAEITNGPLWSTADLTAAGILPIPARQRTIGATAPSDGATLF